jgi:hypothetical protein
MILSLTYLECVYKMVHERIMEDFRRRAKTQ